MKKSYDFPFSDYLQIISLIFLVPTACGLPQYKNDGFCDDRNNNAGCDYDGGACCGSNVKKDYCKHCLCLSGEIFDPSYSLKGCIHEKDFSPEGEGGGPYKRRHE